MNVPYCGLRDAFELRLLGSLPYDCDDGETEQAVEFCDGALQFVGEYQLAIEPRGLGVEIGMLFRGTGAPEYTGGGHEGKDCGKKVVHLH